MRKIPFAGIELTSQTCQKVTRCRLSYRGRPAPNGERLIHGYIVTQTGIFLHKKYIEKIIMIIMIITPNKQRTINLWVYIIRLHGRRGKGTAESFSRLILRQAPQKEGGEILCDLSCVTPAGSSTSLTYGFKRDDNTHTHTHPLSRLIRGFRNKYH